MGLVMRGFSVGQNQERNGPKGPWLLSEKMFLNWENQDVGFERRAKRVFTAEAGRVGLGGDCCR